MYFERCFLLKHKGDIQILSCFPVSWPRDVTQKRNPYLVPTDMSEKKQQQNLLSRGHELYFRKKKQQKTKIRYIVATSYNSERKKNNKN